MEITPALVITRHALTELMEQVATDTANKVLAGLEQELHADPDARVVDRLRRYLDDRSSLDNPREHWANSKLIRQIVLSGKGKPKSVAWLQQFKRESGLGDCPSRASAQHGRLQEWCFEDIANAWERYYFLR